MGSPVLSVPSESCPPMEAILRLALGLAVPLAVLPALTEVELEKAVLSRIQVIDIERILTNDRIINKYLKCMLRQGVCPPEARDFRRTLPTILRKLCDSCTDRQKKSLRQIFMFVRTKFPNEWERLLKLYDPKNEARERLNDFIKT
uniref:Chemosensory protein 8 n=1 Tax=Yemma signatus TaxID=300820 RepID=A0A3G2GRQ6_9HEMI|nr:chemosensory protein 8 [Yemma signatus]